MVTPRRSTVWNARRFGSPLSALTAVAGYSATGLRPRVRCIAALTAPENPGTLNSLTANALVEGEAEFVAAPTLTALALVRSLKRWASSRVTNERGEP